MHFIMLGRVPIFSEVPAWKSRCLSLVMNDACLKLPENFAKAFLPYLLGTTSVGCKVGWP